MAETIEHEFLFANWTKDKKKSEKLQKFSLAFLCGEEWQSLRPILELNLYAS